MMHHINITLLVTLCVVLLCERSVINENTTYDFIVVGAGAAGCVVARRLIENNYTVLLIESGGYPDPDLEIPAKTRNFLTNMNYLKFYMSEPQSNAGLKINGVFHYVVGKTLGGGTGVNGMIYNRGSPYDFNNWANVTSDPSWRYENVLHHFKNIEDYNGHFPSEEQHGKQGPITISQPEYGPGLHTWLEAGKQLGYKTADPNGPQTVGFAPLEFSRKRGKRVSAYQGYLKPLLDAGNGHLKLITNAKVHKIIFEQNKAIGVEYKINETPNSKIDYVHNEVILSAGVMASPVILMKSGIGPKDVLETCKIPAKKILPVGKNLHDHLFLQLKFTAAKNSTEMFVPTRDLNNNTLRIFEESGDGPYSSFHGMHGQAFLVSKIGANGNVPYSLWPDINLHLLQTPVDVLGFEFDPKNTNENDMSFYIALMLTRPKSRGRLMLNHNNFDDGDPLIDFGFLTHPDDLVAIVDGIKQVLQVAENTKAYRQQQVRYQENPIKFCKDLVFRSDDYWRCYIRYLAVSGAHAAGTCKMGNDQDPEAVVNSKLQVFGIENLRVSDTSVMPTVTNTNTQAAAYLIGEKTAAEIIQYWMEKMQQA